MNQSSENKLSDPGSSMSESDMDAMIERASVPNLATLFQKGKDAGLIKPVTGYAAAGGGA